MGTLGAFATRLSGSSDLYQSGDRRPYHSINFVTSHDGYTMSDLVSYEQKHNEANGENNRDGDNRNISCNYGVEGPTNSKPIQRLRTRQIKNMLASLMLSQGVPMIVSGDECRRTQNGNNNAYCQDNDISWFDWNLVEENAELVRFTKSLSTFRLSQPTVRRKDFFSGQHNIEGLSDANWYNALGTAIDWNSNDSSMILSLIHI